MKPILCALALLTLSTLAAPMRAQTDAPKAPNASATRTDDGLIITPLDAPLDYTAKMLGIKLWRFNVRTTQPNLRLTRRLELRQPGQAPTGLDAEISYSPKEFEYALGLMPLGSEGIGSAEKLRLFSEFTTLQTYRDTPESGFSNLGSIANPLRPLKIASYSPSLGLVNANGDISLLQLKGGGPSYPIVAELVLVLTTKPNPEDVVPAKK